MERKLNRRDFLNIVAVSGAGILGGAIAGRMLGNPLTIIVARRMMGTIVQLKVISFDKEKGRRAIESTLAEMGRLEEIFDHRKPLSPLARLNARGVLHNAPQELVEVFSEAIQLGELSKGAFDVTVKPALDALKRGRIPLNSYPRLPGYRNIALDGRTIAYEEKGIQCTLDGIAKGYIVDHGVEVLKSHGFRRIFVDAGGDLMTWGLNQDASAWRVGIAHPRPERMDGYLAVISMESGAVATSGDYFNSYTPDHSVHHIINPKNGKSPPELASVTTKAHTTTLADALSTAIMVMGKENGLDLANRIHGVEALVVTKDLTIHRTAGFPG